MKSACFIPVLLCFSLNAWSQTPSPSQAPAKAELPSGALLKSPGDNAQWEITFTYSDEQKKPNEPEKSDAPKKKASRRTKASPPSPVAIVPAKLDTRPRKILTTKTGRIVHEETTDMMQHTQDVWFEGGSQYVKADGDGTWYSMDKQTGPGAAGSAYDPLPAIGYRDADWIKAENYAGMASYEQRNCLVFVPGGCARVDLGNAGEAEKKLEAVEMVAYVDEETRRPVALRTHDEVRVFRFNPPPKETQKLPDDLVAQIKRGEEARARLNQAAPRPE